MNSLDELLERVKEASGPDRELDAAIGFALGWLPRNRDHYEWIEADGTFVQSVNPKPFTASLDAALALVERLGGFDPRELLGNALQGMTWNTLAPIAPQMARALLAALLSALIARDHIVPKERVPQGNSGRAPKPQDLSARDQ